MNNSNSQVNSNGSIHITANVPGNVVTDLEAAGIIQDPYFEDNDVLYRWIGMDDWTYSTTFTVSSSVLSSTMVRKHSSSPTLSLISLLPSPKVELVAEGLDTIAVVTLNGQQLGQTDNMFRRWRFDVTNVLTSGTNTIEVAFTSAATWANQRAAAYPYVCPTSDDPSVQHGEPNRNFIRKEQCSFSWDWGPCFIPQGIWQPIG
jgi:beta-mannosidase